MKKPTLCQKRGCYIKPANLFPERSKLDEVDCERKLEMSGAKVGRIIHVDDELCDDYDESN